MSFKFNIIFFFIFCDIPKNDSFNHRVYIDDEAEDEITGSQQ